MECLFSWQRKFWGGGKKKHCKRFKIKCVTTMHCKNLYLVYALTEILFKIFFFIWVYFSALPGTCLHEPFDTDSVADFTSKRNGIFSRKKLLRLLLYTVYFCGTSTNFSGVKMQILANQVNQFTSRTISHKKIIAFWWTILKSIGLPSLGPNLWFKGKISPTFCENAPLGSIKL
jgi:hypothetical protein